MTTNGEETERVVRSIRNVTYAGAAVNILVAALKGVGGVLCSSQALVADAVHSVSDLVTDLAVILGVRYWVAPADAEHPYGHGKIQALVTLFIAGALALVAWELGWHAARALMAGGAKSPGLAAFYCALVSVVSKELLFHWTRRVAHTVKSPALEANAWHHRSDAISSVPVAIAVVVAHVWPSLAWLDAVGAILVACFILHVAWEIAHPALQELVDAGIDDKSAEVAAVARQVPGVLAVHQARARRYGGAFQADLHVQVDASLSIGAAHTLGHDVKNAILAAGIDVSDAVIHVEPMDVRAIVSLGSNIEPRAAYLEKARDALAALPCTHLVKASRVIETEPVDVPAEFAGQKFLNQVVVLETALEVEDFARRMHAIEDELGRVRTVRNGPRTIDIDLIDFNGVVRNDPELTLPHPRARSRDFVMRPLAELGITLG
ncbi:MAG: 2-amino-4-hydroxy-6-hydroxymethyldihydropteridine diphosphokinase [Kiritimatiellia bacterium]